MKIKELFEKKEEKREISGKNLTKFDIKNVSQLAHKLKVSMAELKKFSDDELLTVLKNIGEHDFADDSHIDPEELALGIKIEKEHTSSKLIARLIALDHLNEIPNYYTKLEKMEHDAKGK